MNAPRAVAATPLPMAAAAPELAGTVLQLRSSAGLYGADRMVLALNQALAGHGRASRLLSIRNYRMDEQALHAAATACGQDAHLLPCQGRFDLATVRALAAQIRRQPVAALHVHDYKSAFYAWLATRRQPVPLVATLHGWVRNSRSQRFYNRLEMSLLRRFDALVVVSQAQRAALAGAGLAAARIHQIDNGIELPARAEAEDVAALRQELGLPGSAFVFGAVARLSAEKNLPMLLEVFAALARDNTACHLLIAGDGPLREALQAQVRQLGIGERLHLLGARADMHRVYALLDCLVLPSLSEGMPLVVLEAMACAVPVVASAVGEIPRLLRQSAHGHALPAGDAGALRAAMQAALASPGRRDRVARGYVLEQHSSSAMALRYLDLYRSLTAHGHARTTA